MWCPAAFLAASVVYDSHGARIPNLLISSTYFKVGPTVNEKLVTPIIVCAGVPMENPNGTSHGNSHTNLPLEFPWGIQWEFPSEILWPGHQYDIGLMIVGQQRGIEDIFGCQC